ncbi:4'-phosphopantetheinyl transferase superfamily protein [Nonomuraea sp. 3-1Str]|uniref:4'-phosphopantetheinyl transferase family protein n=1 Tax=Nonomuraea sp. 3-1Str TaxID=2929801 RepID=UPI00285CCD9C|nr:4'-phosphopantetheinyl transferase superfamily protein [Nonomuraea sp. 3-1Str]MDR8414794.1 4'-phosphopantetheinyl transferase superfamily protein [Nonomuraea sp. 3-1Str]
MTIGPVAMGGRPDEVRAPEEWLTPVERERAARFAFDADRAAFVAAHLLVRQCAAAALGRRPEELTLLQRCDVHGPGHGRPYVEQAPSLGVSFSHTRGYVCAAVGDGRVGVDAERVPAGPLDGALAEVALTPRERAGVTRNDELIRLWARKEALIKRGELSLDLLRTAEIDWAGRHVLEWTAEADVMVAVITDAPARRLPLSE